MVVEHQDVVDGKAGDDIGLIGRITGVQQAVRPLGAGKRVDGLAGQTVVCGACIGVQDLGAGVHQVLQLFVKRAILIGLVHAGPQGVLADLPDIPKAPVGRLDPCPDLEGIAGLPAAERGDGQRLCPDLHPHLQPLDIRLRYGIPVENPILQDIKREYFFAYTIADQAVVTLREHYQCAIPESEVGWLALIFQMAVESRHAIARLNILIICASGSASSHLLLSRIKRAFPAYIAKAEVCTIFELEHRDLGGIDYIFTTVPIPFPVGVPILEIHDFIQHYELQNIKKVLQRQHMQFLQQFYQERFFFTGISGPTKEEALQQLCAHIRQNCPDLPGGFYESVLKREILGPTDYGNMVAIPHPYEIMTRDNVVAVAVLDKPILWNTNTVQLVVLVSLSADENPYVPSFYNVTSQFVMSETAVSALLAEPTYQKLMDLLCSMDPGQSD